MAVERRALIENGKVVNVVMYDTEQQESALPSGTILGPTGTFDIGYTWDGSAYVPPPSPSVPVTSSDVNAERDRRMHSSFTFAGKSFDASESSLTKINGAVTLASIAISNGILAGDLRWHGGETDFTWTADDDSEVAMDAPTVQAFGSAAAMHIDDIHRKARALKAMDPIPDDYASDIYWT